VTLRHARECIDIFYSGREQKNLNIFCLTYI